MRNTTAILLILAISFLGNSCREENVDTPTTTTYKTHIDGFAQKGPFNTGTIVTLHELSDSLYQTGLNFNTTVYNKFGSFSIPNITLNSNYIELMADGYFFDEFLGTTTDEKLVLRAIADVNDTSSININILTHISVNRIKYLVANEGKSFTEAKTQAQNEILDIFGMADTQNQDYTKLDITKKEDSDKKLLAISSIIISYCNHYLALPRLTEFLTEIALDIEKDGKVDSEEILEELATRAEFCSIGRIRKNLSIFYENDTTFNGFQEYIDDFRESSKIEPVLKLDFAKKNNIGTNLLGLKDNAILDTTTEYCLIPGLNGVKEIEFEIYKTSESGQIIYSPDEYKNSIDGWIYNKYVTSYPFSYTKGYQIFTRNLSAASETPLKITLKGSGELLLITKISSDLFDGSCAEQSIHTFMKW